MSACTVANCSRHDICVWRIKSRSARRSSGGFAITKESYHASGAFAIFDGGLTGGTGYACRCRRPVRLFLGGVAPAEHERLDAAANRVLREAPVGSQIQEVETDVRRLADHGRK